jgi:hypothetical protein
MILISMDEEESENDMQLSLTCKTFFSEDKRREN